MNPLADRSRGTTRPADLDACPRNVLPTSARVADWIVAGLLVIAATVAVSGGFHTQIGNAGVGITSPLRVLAWAIALGFARSYFVRRPSIYAHLSARVRGWIRSEAVVTAATVAIATRPIILLIGYLATSMIGFAANARPFHQFDNDLFNLPLRWDTGWYLQIATTGYAFIERAGPNFQQNIVFFPAYPMIVRGVGLLLGNNITTYVVGGTLTSLVFFFVALMYLYRLAREHLTADKSATAAWLLAAYPFALFFGAIYTESLFLAGTLGAFYHFRKEQFARAGAWGLLVGLTRPNGLFLALPLVICAVERRLLGRRLVTAVCAAAMPVAGALLYSAFIWRLTGNPLTWASGHAAWGRHYGGLTDLVADRYQYIASSGFSTYVGQRPYDFLNAFGVLFVLAAVWPVARRFSLAYAAFILINILPPLSTGGLLSAGRFSAVLFPAFLWLASVIPERHRAGWIGGFAAIQSLNAVLHYTWRPLF